MAHIQLVMEADTYGLSGSNCHLLGIRTVAAVEGIDRGILVTDLLYPDSACGEAGDADLTAVITFMGAGDLILAGSIRVDLELPAR